MKIAVKEVGKEPQIIETRDKYRGACARRFTGIENHVEFVPLNEDGTLCIGVNEDGLPLGLPINFLLHMNSIDWPIQKMVGTVVFVRHRYVNPWKKEIYDFEVEDLTEKDMELIEKILSSKYQDELSKYFVDYGKGCAVVTSLKTGERKIL